MSNGALCGSQARQHMETSRHLLHHGVAQNMAALPVGATLGAQAPTRSFGVDLWSLSLVIDSVEYCHMNVDVRQLSNGLMSNQFECRISVESVSMSCRSSVVV